MPSNELVPQSYYRDAWNTVHGTELQAHNDALTAEQAERINSTYDIQVYTGLHGRVPEAPGTPHLTQLAGVPLQKEYDEVARVIDSMEKGDTLFTEGYGFTGQPSPRFDMDAYVDLMRRVMQVDRVTHDMVTEEQRQHSIQIAQQRQQLEDLRRRGRITTFDYARGLAEIKGIRVINADYDAFEEEAVAQLAGKSLDEALLDRSSQAAAELADRLHNQRERKGRNTLKDDALIHEEFDRRAAPAGRKPKLVMLYGDFHRERLDDAFKDMKLKATVTAMNYEDDPYQRQIAHLKGMSPFETFQALVPAAQKVGSLVTTRRVDKKVLDKMEVFHQRHRQARRQSLPLRSSSGSRTRFRAKLKPNDQ